MSRHDEGNWLRDPEWGERGRLLKIFVLMNNFMAEYISTYIVKSGKRGRQFVLLFEGRRPRQ